MGFFLALIFSQIFATQIQAAPACAIPLSAEVCKVPPVWRPAVAAQASRIHKLSLPNIPGGDLSKATRDEYVRYLLAFEKQIEVDLHLSVAEIKLRLKSVQDQLVKAVQAEKRLPVTTQNQMIARLLRAQFLLPSEYVAQSDPDEAMYTMLMACGFGTQLDNAFTMSARGAVIVCPARLVRLALLSADGEKSAGLRGLAHEMGHQIDSAKFPDVYRNWSLCEKAHYDVKSPKLSQPFATYMVELTADYWAAGVAISAIQKESSVGARLQVIKELYEDLCGLGDSPPQASGADRIDFGLVTHPAFSSPGVCAPTTPACGL